MQLGENGGPSTMGDFSRFNSWASGVQALSVALGVIIGGGWSLYTFDALGTRNRAQWDLKSVQRLLEQRGRLSVTLDVVASQFAGHKDQSVAVVTAVLSNKGTRDMWLSLEGSQMTLRAVGFDDDGDPEYGEWVKESPNVDSLPGVPLKSAVVAAGCEVRIPFVFRVQTPGVYQVSFDVPAGPKDLSEAESAGHPAAVPGVFSGVRYFVVGEVTAHKGDG